MRPSQSSAPPDSPDSPDRPDGGRLRPLSTRSVILSLLLAAHPPELTVRELIHCLRPFGIAEATLRVALSRMVTAGDLQRVEAGYRLSDRLVERQHRQDAAVRPRTRAWRGAWEMVVVTASGRGPAERAQLREELAGLRLAELREGVWLRPANLRRAWPEHLAAVGRRFVARPDEPADELVGALWRLDGWAGTAAGLLHAFAAATQPAEAFAVAAAAVRHLLADPVLPPALLPADWPGPGLRAAYARYRGDVLHLARTGHYPGEASA